MPRVHSGAGHPSEVALGLIGLLATSNSSAAVQIPITT